mmetsp:Transcript_52398/g.157229  ORF Transcript_52398/g.157229 Transcript_52398/m.157229 type:complete len:212 (-) Transcript_52398:20-655(-)|eukprot:CAMPEP_0113536376 /NCGR_PEP_ID=MMETSP0015_2-20120614/6224_1 /TAXON_ID=2838 /ORGANISM="Odontella" /LENGTH=211 /DNA_ID=CAMNT_0000435729 /DNA_START=173 /DNA_END=808 /DNA_ORIENTATION=+ /assembly_acc=CAM_ASM_000160
MSALESERKSEGAKDVEPSTVVVSKSTSTDGAEGTSEGLSGQGALEGSGRHGSDDRPEPLTQDQRIAFARAHYERKGYRVHSGLQFGCEIVLYADDPSSVHSDFCVHVTSGSEGRVNWRMVQTLVRSMSDFHKTLILAHVRPMKSCCDLEPASTATGRGGSMLSAQNAPVGSEVYEVVELAIATEHAPFRHKTAKRRKVEVGSQKKRKKAF